ncbi:TonB-dependent receptor plug domain-containing protein [Tenacibaculum ovolyticum]|uniref:TonB-dependent receptor n=1 Tax=Tenacibaculum ovolyticum TaxID=104270 RepID=UPI0022F3D7B8|nr:TonB-dependent receptor [Tenacibaculum ovolyticum]WBX77054.1 TonB-dependent receptor plug domain-containing protein [Tenacibaculum ovolyticum]
MRKSKLFYVAKLLLFFFACVSVHSQVAEEKVALQLVIDTLKEQHKIQFNYESNLLTAVFVVPPSEKLSLNKKIKILETQTSLKFSKISAKIISISKVVKICGYIKSEVNDEVLEGATVVADDVNTVTDKEGYFNLVVSSLTGSLSIRFLGFKTFTIKLAELYVENCNTLFLEEESEFIDPIVITEYLVSGIDKSKDGGTTINFSKFSSLPGVIDTDVLQTIQALPGIQSTDETVSNINIRGGSHDQNLIMWDDIKMYQSGHFFGLISSFNPQITKKASVIANGTDASYTDGVSGVVSMKTDEKIETVFNGNISVNFISANAFLDIPISEKSSLQLAGRKSINNWVKTPTYQAYFDRVTQLTEVETNSGNVLNSNQNFDFYDTSLRWIYHPSKKEILRLNFILINNGLSFNETAEVNKAIESKKSSLFQNSIAAGVSYERKWNSKFSTLVHLYETDYKLQAVNANVLQNQRFLQENKVSETGIKVSGVHQFKEWNLKVGYQLIESKITNLNDIDNPRFVRLNSNVIREHAIFAQANYQHKKGFSARPGIRINYNSKFSNFLLEPRLHLNQKINNALAIEFLGEFKHQNSTQIINFQNDFLGVEKRRWQLANEQDIPVLKSKQASLGLLYSKKGWLFDTKAYYKKVDGITAQSQGFTTKYEFKKVIGAYNVLGVDFLFRKKIKNLSTWFSYSFLKNEYEFDALTETKFPSNFDNTHSVAFGSTYTNESLKFSAGFNYRTGKPTSVPIKGNEIVGSDINFAEANDSRVKDFFRVDASVIYNFKISDDFRSEIGASIWNLLDRENTINNYYRVGEDKLANKFSRLSLGVTTNFIFRVYF